MQDDPLLLQAQADAIVRRAADQLRELLHRLAARIDPFPEFPGSFFSYGIELDPDGIPGADTGCVVLGEDGELYELRIGLDPQQALSRDPVAERSEERIPLELSPERYVAYAHRAVAAAVALLEARAAR